MKSSVYVFDPTADDKQSAVRGVGRYLQLLKENFKDDFQFISEISNFKFPLQGKQISNSVFINPFFNFLQPPLTTRRLAEKQIAVIHDLIPLKYPEHFPAGIKGSINIFLNKLALKNYDLVVTDSAASKKDIVQILKIEESRVKVIYPCLPKSFNENFKFQTSNFKFVLYVGDVTWNKNLVILAQAIKIANISCIFVGKAFKQLCSLPSEALAKDGWLKEFNEFKELAKDDKRFIFKGFLPDYKLVKLYQQARANILISRDEGFGFSYLEAAQFGCPSVLSDTTILKEISNNKGAVFAYPNDPNDIVNKLKKVFFDDELHNKLSLEAQQQAKHFSSKKFRKDWLQLVNLI